MLVWIDMETTGLDPHTAEPLEMALVVTEDDLTEVVSRVWLIHPNTKPWEWPEIVQQMHTKNRLIADLEWDGYKKEFEGGQELHVVEQEAIDFVNGAHGVPLGGSSLHLDRSFLDHYMPKLSDCFHYRSIDVSTIKELSRRWFPTIAPAPTPDEDKAHRALDDVRATLDELRYYRDNMFVPVVSGFNS